MFNRIFLIVMDSLGIGNAPDSSDYGDEGSNTLKSICRTRNDFPVLSSLGLFDAAHLFKEEKSIVRASYGVMNEKSSGKDTTTGHWEISGIITERPFDTFPCGFPKEFISEFEKEAKVKVLCNLPYSGTKVIEDYGEEHIKSGALIVYTSADSVFQIAAHEDVVPIDKLYEYCKIARRLLDEKYRVGRVIARPFKGKKGAFFRTERRHDFSMLPPYNMLDALKDRGYMTIGVGKISDIFAGKGLSENLGVNTDNSDGMRKTYGLLNKDFKGLAFINLVDGDMIYGHRRDVKGYFKCVNEFDNWLGDFIKRIRENELVVVTADHGCDPSFKGTDHTRERVPLIVYGKNIKHADLGERKTFADISASVLENFNLPIICGESFLKVIL